MQQIMTRTDLWLWLEGKPAEWPGLLSARCALRALPLVRMAVGGHKYALADDFGFIVAALRANFVLWVACKYSSVNLTPELEIACAEVERTGRVTPYVAEVYDVAASNAGLSVVYATSAFVQENSIHHAARAAEWSLGAMSGITPEGDQTNDLIEAYWWAVDVDATQLEKGKNIIDMKLWPKASQPFFDEANYHLENNILDEVASDWHAWVNWYEAVRAGGDVYKTLSRADEQGLLIEWAQLAQKDWIREPKVLNALIAAIEQKYL